MALPGTKLGRISWFNVNIGRLVSDRDKGDSKGYEKGQILADRMICQLKIPGIFDGKPV